MGVGQLRISGSARMYKYLILSSQASVRSHIIGSTASALTAQEAFLNNLENIVNCRVDIPEDIKQYQNTLRHSSSMVNYSIGFSIYMLPSDMNLNIRLGTVRYNNKILIFNGTFCLGKNDKVNTLEFSKEGPKLSHKVIVQLTITHNLAQKTNYHLQRGNHCLGTLANAF